MLSSPSNSTILAFVMHLSWKKMSIRHMPPFIRSSVSVRMRLHGMFRLRAVVLLY